MDQLESIPTSIFFSNTNHTSS